MRKGKGACVCVCCVEGGGAFRIFVVIPDNNESHDKVLTVCFFAFVHDVWIHLLID